MTKVLPMPGNGGIVPPWLRPKPSVPMPEVPSNG